MSLSVIELCAGAGGQALGLEAAGFESAGAFEIDRDAVATLAKNRPAWNPEVTDIRDLNGREFKGVDLLAGGLPCPPFSIAGKQLGAEDERDMFPTALRLVQEARPTAVLIENVPGLSSKRFADYRRQVLQELRRLGYAADWKILNAADFGVPQVRRRFVLVAVKESRAPRFHWPKQIGKTNTVGPRLLDLMAERGWSGADSWARAADKVGPTLVGGSKKHGGPDLGPTRAKKAWAELRVDGKGVADAAPPEGFPVDGSPKLTVRMTARVQGFPDWWEFSGKKTAAYRQIGNAFPPPVAAAVGLSLVTALNGKAGSGKVPPLDSILFQVA